MLLLCCPQQKEKFAWISTSWILRHIFNILVSILYSAVFLNILPLPQQWGVMGWPRLWNEPWPVGSLVLQPKGEWWREGRLSLVSGNRWHSFSANPTGMYIPTSQSQFKCVLGAESCFTLLFHCTQPKHDLASCLYWQKMKCFSLPRKPVSILCKSPRMLWSIAEAVICVCAAFLAQGIEAWQEAVLWALAVLCTERGIPPAIIPLFLKSSCLPCHSMVAQSNRYRDGENNLCHGWGQSRSAECPISAPGVQSALPVIDQAGIAHSPLRWCCKWCSGLWPFHHRVHGTADCAKHSVSLKNC